MNRFTYGFGRQIDRTRFFILAFLAVTILGCRQGGISIVPLGVQLQIHPENRTPLQKH